MHLHDDIILVKLDELKTLPGNIKAVVIGIADSKIDNFVSVTEVETPCYCNLRSDGNRNRRGVASYVKQDLCFRLRSTVKGDIGGVFLNILLTKTRTIFVGTV